MMIAYELHRPRPEDQDRDTRHEVILMAINEIDTMRLLAIISIFQQGVLDQWLDQAIAKLATEELPNAFEDAARQNPTKDQRATEGRAED